MDSVNLRDNRVSTQLQLIEDNIPGLKELLAVYPEEQQKKLLENKDKLHKIAATFSNMSGFAVQSSIVMICNTNKCPYKESCILNIGGVAPNGNHCPIERKLISELQFDLIRALNIDPGDPIEMEMLWDLIDAKLLDMRSSGTLGDGRTISETVNEGKFGRTVKEEINPALNIKLELKNLKHSIIDQFVASRRAKKKYGMESSMNSLEKLLQDAVNKKKDL